LATTFLGATFLATFLGASFLAETGADGAGTGTTGATTAGATGAGAATLGSAFLTTFLTAGLATFFTALGLGTANLKITCDFSDFLSDFLCHFSFFVLLLFFAYL